MIAGYKYLIACDPGEKGSFAVFERDGGDWFLEHTIKNSDFRSLIALELYPALGVIESNHGIQGQPAGTSYVQGYNAGLVHRTLELVCNDVIKVIPQRWMRVFQVPKGMETTARKKWIQSKVNNATEGDYPLWATDAIAIGLSYIKEMRNQS